MIDPVPPPVIFILGALLVPFLKGRWKSALLVLIPVAAFFNLIRIPEGDHWTVLFLGQELVLGRVDRLSLLFGYIFHLISFIAIVYSLHVQDDLQHAAGLVYAGSAIGVVFAGDLYSFFVFWEMLTVASVFLIWSRKTPEALGAGFRYLLVHAAGGLILLAGIVLHVGHTGSIAFDTIGLGSPGSFLIFIGFGLNCAWPVLHPWLTDAYPEATVTGTVFLAAFTTKAAVYALARAFPGTGALIWIGAVMAIFPIFYAVIENDLRRVLAYSLINQLAFMVCGIGIGTPMAINGAVAHVFSHVIYKTLLFMSMGAVLHCTGKIKSTDLGGLYRTMPLTCVFCMVGALSMSVPLFCGFVSKSMVMDAAASGHMGAVWLVLLFASAGVFLTAGIKVPYFAFFSRDSGLRPKEAPFHMLLAMGIAACLCVGIGSYPWLLYRLLPYPEVVYQPFTVSHVLGQLQLLFFSGLGFALLLLSGMYPEKTRGIHLDVDWFYRKGGRLFAKLADKGFNGLNAVSDRVVVAGLAGAVARLSRDLTARLALIPLAGLWLLAGVKGRTLDMKKRRAYDDLLAGTVPIGVGVSMAALFLAIIFLLT